MPQEMSSARFVNWFRFIPILIFCLVSGIIISLVQTGRFVFGSEAGGWTYRYFQTETSILLWIPGAVILLIGLWVFLGTRYLHRFEWAVIGVSLPAGIAIQILANSLYPVGVYDIINSTVANSFYPVSLRYNAFELLSNFSNLVSSFPLHARTNMPGKILFFHLLGLFTQFPRILAYLVISVSTLGGLVTYAICRRLFNDRIVAFYGLLLYCLIPCKLIYFPILNTVTPVFILLCLYSLILYLDKKKPLFLVLLGILLYVLVLFEPSPLATGFIFVAVLVHALGQRKIETRELIKIVLIPAAAFAVVYLLMRLIFSFDLFEMLAYMVKDAVQFNVGGNRGYWIWIVENSKEFLYGVGLPVGMIFLMCLFQFFFIKGNLKKNLLQWPIENLYLLSLLITYLIILLLGINRGEITRLWIYLAAFFQIPAAWYMGKVVKQNFLFFVMASTIAIQSMVALQNVNFIIP